MSSVNPDYSLLPEGLRGGMERYLEHGIEPGSFLCAVLSDQLVESFACADEGNRAAMFQIASFVYNEVPRNAWGSRAIMREWMNKFKHRGAEEAPGEYYAPLPAPHVEICSECNEPIIDGQASCHKEGCESNQDVEY